MLVEALGGWTADERVSDPLGRPITARLGWIEDELARDRRDGRALRASASLAPSERDAEAASTFGTGELIVAAVTAGATRVALAAGGSASTDGGAGAIQAIEAAGGLRGARADGARGREHAVRAGSRGVRSPEGGGCRRGRAPDGAAARTGRRRCPATRAACR